ncbi:hypothetical protein FRC06_002776, partial [Ceratobasidium sp. 370]
AVLVVVPAYPIVLDSAASASIPTPPASFAGVGHDNSTVATPDPAPVTPTLTPLVSLAAYPTPFAAVGILDSRPSWASELARILLWIAPLAVNLGIGIGLYLAPAEGAELPDIPKILRLLEEFGDLPSIINEHGISPGELRQDIELVLRTRRSVYGEPAAEAEMPSAHGKCCLFLKVNRTD